MTSGFGPVLVADSPWTRLDPRWKLATFSVAGLLAVLPQSLPAALAGLGFSSLLILLGRIPLLFYCKRAAPVILLAALLVAWLPFVTPGEEMEVGPLKLSERGLARAALVLAKAITVFHYMLALWSTTPLEAALKAAHRLRVPGMLVQLIGLTYRYIFVLRDEARRLRIALRTRGFRGKCDLHSCRTLGHAGGSLLTRGVERAERVHHAMQCRGFDGRYRSLTEFHARAADIVFFVMVVGIALGLLAWDVLSRWPGS